MKRNLIALCLCCFLLTTLLSGCLAWMDADDEPVEMTSIEDENGVGVQWEGRRYYSLCPLPDSSDMGKKFGFVDGDPKWEIHLYAQGSSDEWLVEYYRSGEMDVPWLLREEHVTEIPEGLEEYDED